MRYRTPLLLAALCFLVTCKDDPSDPSDPCQIEDVSTFFELERNVILSESFNNNDHGWEMSMKHWLAPELCDTTTLPMINNGLLIAESICDRDTAAASWGVPNITGNYLAAEVEFNQFDLRMSCYANQYNDAHFIMRYGNLELSIGLEKLHECFRMDLSGHTVHFLLDLEKEQGYAYTDEFIDHYDGEPFGASGQAGIVDTDISAIVSVSKRASTRQEVVFQVITGFLDIGGPTYGTIQIESVEIYEPVLEGCE